MLSLLNWVSNEDKLEESLLAVCKVSGEEIVKFLQDVLDSLFNILQTSTSYTLDDTVFSCLVSTQYIYFNVNFTVWSYYFFYYRRLSLQIIVLRGFTDKLLIYILLLESLVRKITRILKHNVLMVLSSLPR